MPTSITINTEILSEEIWRNAEASQVYLYLLANADDNMEVTASQKEISRATRLSIQQVKTAVKKLELTKLLTKKVTKFLTKVTYSLSVSCDTLPTKKLTKLPTKKVTKQKEPKSTAKFTPPTLEEVTEYVLEKQYHFNPEQFISFYQSNGWKVGKNPMKDWKAALCTWEQKWVEKYGYRYFYQVTIQSTNNGTIQDSRAQSRERLRAVATEIVAGSQALYDLYNDKK